MGVYGFGSVFFWDILGAGAAFGFGLGFWNLLAASCRYHDRFFFFFVW